MTDKKLLEVFNENRQKLILMDRKRFHIKMFDMVDVENAVDDCFIWAMNGKQKLDGFNDDVHFIKYITVLINDRARKSYFIKRCSMLKECKMSDSTRFEQLNLVREIINNARELKK